MVYRESKGRQDLKTVSKAKMSTAHLPSSSSEGKGRLGRDCAERRSGMQTYINILGHVSDGRAHVTNLIDTVLPLRTQLNSNAHGLPHIL